MKKKIPTSPASTLTTELVATVAASLADLPGDAATPAECDRLVLHALNLVERSAIAVEGEGCPTAIRAARCIADVQIRNYLKKRAEEEQDEWDDKIDRRAEETAQLLNGKSFSARMSELGFVRKSATLKVIEDWESKHFPGAPERFKSEDAERSWRLIQYLKGDPSKIRGQLERAEAVVVEPGRLPYFDPHRDWRILIEIKAYSDEMQAEKHKRRSRSKKAAGKKLSQGERGKNEKDWNY
jgi:hypothetical protein